MPTVTKDRFGAGRFFPVGVCEDCAWACPVHFPAEPFGARAFPLVRARWRRGRRLDSQALAVFGVGGWSLTSLFRGLYLGDVTGAPAAIRIGVLPGHLLPFLERLFLRSLRRLPRSFR